jgi:hypothetical protein
MVTWRMVVDATLDADADDGLQAACQAAADYFQAIADGTVSGTVFDGAASTSLAPTDDAEWDRYTDGIWVP